MTKPLKFQIEFTGYQHARIDADGDVLRPADAEAIARAIAEDIRFKLATLTPRSKFKVKITRC